MKRGPLKVFYSYAHEDEKVRDRIDEYLELLARQHLIVRWHDRHILPGSEWNTSILDALESADIILLLVSKAFFASKYISQYEVPAAMQAHQSGKARVVPILLESVRGWKKTEFAKLQFLPKGAKPVARWKDPVDAFADIANGIRKVAKDIIVAGGGPFEFGPHEFSEAELAHLPKPERERTASGLERLRKNLNKSIPARGYESNLLLATWSLRQFGKSTNIPADQNESLLYMAQVISSFDLVALQEVDRNLKRLRSLTDVLGPDWNVLVSETAPGNWGNNERFAILYYTPRVEFRNFSGQVILPPKRGVGEKPVLVEQLARPPLLAAFRSANYEFQVCSAHILFGGGPSASLEEVRKLGKYLSRRSRYENSDLYLLGSFQMGKRNSPILDALIESGIEIPDETLLPTNIKKNKYFDLIGFAPAKKGKIPLSSNRRRVGVFDLFKYVFQDRNYGQYLDDPAFKKFSRFSRNEPRNKKERERYQKKRFGMWKTYLISDHLPLWVELDIEKA